MANAFNSLYSHVSRTPVQKLATPDFSFSSSPIERMERFRSSVRSEPRSPVERLKDTVSKMCLYTGSPRGSESTSPQPSPKKRASLPDVDKVKTKKLELEENNQTDPAEEMKLSPGGVNTEADRSGEHVDELNAGVSVSSSRSGETAIKSDQPLQPELDSRTANRSRVGEVTRESSDTHNQEASTFVPSGSGTEHTDRSQLSLCGPASGSFPVSSQCSITVSGWDGGDVTPDPRHLGLPCWGGRGLSPNSTAHQGLSPVAVGLRQANSLELEEVRLTQQCRGQPASAKLLCH